MKHASPAATGSLLTAQNCVSLKTQGRVLWTEMWVAACPVAPPGGLSADAQKQQSTKPRPVPGCFMGSDGPVGAS